MALTFTACGGDGASDETSTTAQDADAATEEPSLALIQGHRGARGLRPENTLPAFETALDLGVGTLELDLHLSVDGVVVVWHDPVIDPAKCGAVTGSQPAPPDPDDPDTTEDELRVSALAIDELRGYRCDRNPDPDRFPDQSADPGELSGDDYSIPSLDDVFAFVAAYAESDAKTEEQRRSAARVRFNIETKRVPDDPEAIGDGFDGERAGAFELAVLGSVEAAGLVDRTTIQSFDHRSLWAVRAENTDIGLAALTRRGDIPDFEELVVRGATVWSPDHRTVGAAVLAAAHEAGLTVIPWTVNDPDDMRELMDLGVDGIITDRPDLAPVG